MTADIIHTLRLPDSTAAEVIDGIDLSGKRAIVTGAASGIGIETARALAGAGAEVTLAVRDTTPASGPPPRSPPPPATRSRRRLDLADQSVAAFAAGWDGPLHLLSTTPG